MTAKVRAICAAERDIDGHADYMLQTASLEATPPSLISTASPPP